MTSSFANSPASGRAGPHRFAFDHNSPNRLQLFTEWQSTADVVITAIGDIDMSTAHRFSDYVFRRAGNCQQLRLDLSQVRFFDCAGFAALCYIDDRCHMAGVTWTIEPSYHVSRVVGICDPLTRLPMPPTADVA